MAELLVLERERGRRAMATTAEHGGGS